jgi:hypothetical protein
MRRIAIGKPHPFARKAVEMRRLHDFVSVTTNVAIAEVVAEDDNDVGRSVSGGRTKRSEQENRKQALHAARLSD